MALMITGMSNSNSPIILSPITRRSDAIINVKYPPRAEANTRPVIAQITPIMEKTIAVPNIKKQSCTKVLNGLSFEYPPTYPIISGSIASEQGDIEAINPPAKDAANIKNQIYAPLLSDENIAAKLSIF